MCKPSITNVFYLLLGNVKSPTLQQKAFKNWKERKEMTLLGPTARWCKWHCREPIAILNTSAQWAIFIVCKAQSIKIKRQCGRLSSFFTYSLTCIGREAVLVRMQAP